MEVHFKLDRYFLTPKAHLVLQFATDLAYLSKINHLFLHSRIRFFLSCSYIIAFPIFPTAQAQKQQR